MNKFGKFSFVLIVLGLIGGCSSAEKSGVGDKIEVDELIFAQNPEPVRGKLDVYASMARGVKPSKAAFSIATSSSASRAFASFASSLLALVQSCGWR